MPSQSKLCMHCMNPVGSSADACPHCGYDGSQQNPDISLPIGHMLRSRYAVGKMLDADGDSVSYLGYDLTTSCKVEIREYLPLGGCARLEDMALVPNAGAELHFKTSLMDFTELFTNLRKINSEPGLIQVLDFFKENNTAYAVTELFEGMSLKEFLSIKNDALSVDQCMMLIDPVINGLVAVHSVNLIHRGVSPETIFLNRKGTVKLGGYATTSVRTKGTEVNSKLFPGYSAPEQYSTTQWQSAATDVYALGATIYRGITAAAPQDADQRRSFDNLLPAVELNDAIDVHVSSCLEKAMLLDAEQRIQTALVFKKMMSGEYVEDLESQPESKPPKTKSKATPEQRRQRAKVVMISAIVLLGIALAAFLLKTLLSGGAAGEEDPGAEETVMVAVPDYLGLTLDEAKAQFNYADFKFQIESEYSENYEEGEIVRQSPSQNAQVEKGTALTLYVNEPIVFEMPDLIGLTQKNAELKLNEIPGVNAATMKIEYETVDSSTEIPGSVIRQNYDEGEAFDVTKDTLKLTIARRPSS